MAWQTGQKSSSLDSVSKHRNRVHWTRFLSKEIESNGLDLVTQLWHFLATQRVQNEEERSFRRCKPSRRFWPNPAGESFKRCKTQRSDVSHRRDDAKTMKLQAPGFGQNRCRDDAKTMKLQAPGFGQNRRLCLVRIGGCVWLESAPGFHSLLLSSSFWTLRCFFLLRSLDFLSRNDEHSQFYWNQFLYIEIDFNKLSFYV